MKQRAPATQRNRQPILSVLERVLPARGRVLEIASGSGEHAVYFASQLPGVTWQPSDVGAAELASISAWAREAKLANLEAPIVVDAAAESWPIAGIDAIVNINMIHISPWASCAGLLRGAGASLARDGVLYLYGPFRRASRPTAPSNEDFDRSLKRRNPAWGVRQLEEVVAVAGENGFALAEVVDMPANNLSVVFARE
jgi:cyclopropane fatty-acyl-phospholipid synthase-like methyltransferase